MVARLDMLLATHPLEKEVRRLRDAENRLRNQVPSVIVGIDSTAALPGLAAATGPTDAAVRQAIDSRRAQEKRLLEAETERSVDAFKAERENRLNSLLARIRVEKQAELEARDAALERQRREAIDQDTVARLEILAKRRLAIMADRSVLRAQLDPGSVFLPPVVNSVQLSQQVAQVAAVNATGMYLPDVLPTTLIGLDPASDLQERLTTGLSMRPRLEYRRIVNTMRLREVNTEILRVTQNGEEAKRRISDALAIERQNEIEDEVRRRRAAMDESPVAGSWSSLGEALDLERRLSVPEDEGTSGAGDAVGTKTEPVTLPGAVQVAAQGGTGRDAAVARIARLRAELETRVRAAVSDAIRDTARIHGLNVVIVDEAQGGAMAGLPDYTGEFARWIAPGTVSAE